MSAAAKRRLCDLIAQFTSGKDMSLALANEIEGLLIEEFADSDIFEQLTEPLALYRPGGSAPYVGEEELTTYLREVEKDICRENS